MRVTIILIIQQDSDSDSELDIEGPSSPSDLRDEELVSTFLKIQNIKYKMMRN